MKDIAQKIESAVAHTVESMGYELAGVEFVNETDGLVLVLYIHKDEGITVDDCETVSRAVDPIIDELDPIDQAYYLSVSSVGLDRPLVTSRDFQRNINRSIDIFLKTPFEKKTEFVGTLVYAGDDKITVLIKGAKKSFARENVSLVRPHIDFK